MKVGGRQHKFLVDTGAQKNAISIREAPDIPLSGHKNVSVGFSGTPVVSNVSQLVPVEVGNFTSKLAFLVTENCAENLLGLGALKSMYATIHCTPDDVYITLDPPAAKSRSFIVRPLPPELMVVPDSLWATDDTDVGLLDIPPVQINLKPNAKLPKIPQYKLSVEGEKALKQIVSDLVHKGVVEEISGSICNSPILPVYKKGDNKIPYRLVIDLRELNKVVEPQYPIVPDITAILTMIPSTACWYSVLDLKNAFFSVPVAAESRYLLAFSLGGRSFQFKKMPQGYTESPSIYSRTLKAQLDALSLPKGCVLIQYIDDLLLAADSEELCKEGTVALLQHLCKLGHKASLKKFQYCREQVAYLGYLLSKEGRTITPERVALIMKTPVPRTQTALRSFLGLTSYCRQWIPNFSLLAKPLLALTKKDVDVVALWTPEVNTAFVALRSALCNAPVLGTPDYTKEFVLFVHETNGCALSVLTQDHGGRQRPCAYLSSTLDPVACALPKCLRAVAAAAASVKQSEGMVLGHSLTVMVPHAVETLLNVSQTQFLTAARLTKYELILFASHIKLKRCTNLNPAQLMPIVSDDDPIEHDCIIITEQETKGRIDLSDTPLKEWDAELYCDGSCFKLPTGTSTAAYAVTTTKTVVETARISKLSAQAAELIALIRACELSENLRVNVWTDSQYAFGVAQNFGKLWAERGFLTSHGTKIQHGELISRLLLSLSLPAKLAIMKCAAHKKVVDEVGEGNRLADETAKATALDLTSPMYTVREPEVANNACAFIDTLESVRLLQEEATIEEKQDWEKKELAHQNSEGMWVTHDDEKWMLPDAFVTAIVTAAHGSAHINAKAICKCLEPIWKNKNIAKTAERLVQNCMVCLQHNQGKGTPTPVGSFAPPTIPFECIHMDFIEMERCQNYKNILVVVCAFSKWIEAYSLRNCTAMATAKALLKEYFPRFGLPRLLYSDNGVHFIADVIKHVCEGLGIQKKFHTAYHPQSAGLVERHNGILKNKLAKICASTKLKWPDALPLALMSMRTVAHSKTGLSPYEVVMGRPANVWGAPKHKRLSEIQYPLLVDYCKQLTQDLSLIHQQVKDALPPRYDGPGHQIKPGDFVLIKDFVRKSCLAPRWKGPFQVLLATQTAIRVEGKKHWIHGTHAKRLPFPLPDGKDTHDKSDSEAFGGTEPLTSPQPLQSANSELELFEDHSVPGNVRYNLRSRN